MNAARAPGVASSAARERLRRDAVRHAELRLVLGRDPGRQAAGEHQPVDHRRVGVALHDDRRAERRQREAERVVALRRAVGQKPRARRAVGLGGELLGALVRRRRRPEVDAVDVLRDVELERLPADRGAHAEVGAVAGLVAGHVEAGGAAEPVGDDRVEVRRGRLVRGGHVSSSLPRHGTMRGCAPWSSHVNTSTCRWASGRCGPSSPRRPPTGAYPGIVFYTDIFQLTEPTLRWAVRLAGYGFVVAVPEIYHRVEPAGTVLGFDDAGKVRGQADADATPVPDFDADVAAALGVARGRAARRSARPGTAPAGTSRSARRSTRVVRGDGVLVPDRAARRQARQGRRRTRWRAPARSPASCC